MVRSIKRIDRILKKIKLIWEKSPDQRLFQLLSNYTKLGKTDKIGYVKDPFHYEDDELEAQLDAVIKNGNL
jgi:uncharacterized protein YihD (DUF1040 family)